MADSSETLSPKQFGTSDSLAEQANPDADVAKIRGWQTNTANVYRPAFSDDYNSPAPANPGANLAEEA